MKHKSFMKKVAIFAGCLSVLFLAAIVVSSFMRARYETATSACINNLRLIDASKIQWAIEHHAKTNDVVSMDELTSYFGRSGKLACPAGGRYTIGKIGKPPTCSLGTTVTSAHALQ